MNSDPLFNFKVNDIVLVHSVGNITTNKECFLKIKILNNIWHRDPARPAFFGLVLQSSNRYLYSEEYSYWFFPLSPYFTVIKIKE